MRIKSLITFNAKTLINKVNEIISYINDLEKAKNIFRKKLEKIEKKAK